MLTKHLISKLSAGLGTGNRVASATIKESAKHYAERRDGHKSPRIALLAAMMIAIMMGMMMTNEAGADCPEGYERGTLFPIIFLNAAKTCQLKYTYCVHPTTKRVIFDTIMIVGSGCTTELYQDLVENYQKYVDTCMKYLLPDLALEFGLTLPPCNAGTVNVWRYGTPSCITDIYTWRIYIANGPPLEVWGTHSCTPLYSNTICWNIAKYCWEEATVNGRLQVVAKLISVERTGTEGQYIQCPDRIWVNIPGTQGSGYGDNQPQGTPLNCHPVCR